jgi:hypothetical protein
LILDFTLRLETNPDHTDFSQTKTDMVELFKSFSSGDENERRHALEILLTTLELTGIKEQYQVSTFAEISR